MSIIHPSLLTRISGFFPDSCTIQTLAEAADSHGELVKTWSNYSGHVGLGCSVAPSKGSEIKTGHMEYVISTHTISLQGGYPNITEGMRAVIGSDAYDILLVKHSSHDNAPTVLECQLVEV